VTRYTCLECGRLTSASYCPQHEQEATQRRLQAVAMRYGRRHELRRQAAVGSGGAWATLRQRVFAAQGGLCALCGWPMARERFEVDHVVPVAAGGSSDPGNLRALHPECHRSRGVEKSRRAALQLRAGGPAFSRGHDGAGGQP